MRSKPCSFFSSLFLLSIYSIMASCGLEVYTYLKPVTAVKISELQKTVSINLPDNDDARRYVVCYKIYGSSLDADALGAYFLSSPEYDDEINPTMQSDYYRMNSYSSPSSTVDATSLYDIIMGEDNLGFSELMHCADVVRNDSLNELDSIQNYRSTQQSPYLLDSSLAGTIQFEFEVLTGDTNPAHPVLRIIDGDEEEYRILIDKNGKDFLDRDLEDEDMTGDDKEFSYVLLYIFALGMDSSTYTTIISKPCFIGAFQLP